MEFLVLLSKFKVALAATFFKNHFAIMTSVTENMMNKTSFKEALLCVKD